jgi:hypothetical protein
VKDATNCYFIIPTCRGTLSDCEKICSFKKSLCINHCKEFTTLDTTKCEEICTSSSCVGTCKNLIPKNDKGEAVCRYCKRIRDNKLRLEISYDSSGIPITSDFYPRFCLKVEIPLKISTNTGLKEVKEIMEIAYKAEC